jgi:cytochrome c biogenesis protein
LRQLSELPREERLEERGPGGTGKGTRSAPAQRPLEFARWIWRQLTSMRTALLLLFLLALAAIPGSLIPQTAVDPSAVFAFRDRHPSLAPVFDRLGLFAVYSSVFFSAVYLLLMVSLVGCIVPRLRVYAKAFRARPPQAPRNLSRLSAYQSWETPEPVEVTVERALVLLRSQRRRTEVYRQDGAVAVSAEKGYLREAGNLLFHLALLVVLVGVAVTHLYGFKGTASVVTGDGFSNSLIEYDDFTPGAGFQPSDLAPFSFKVQDFSVDWQRTGPGRGTPVSFDASLSVSDAPGARPYNYDLRVNSPLVVDGTSVFLIGHGYAPNVTVRDGNGNVAYSGPVIFLPQDGSFVSFGVIKVPDAAPTQLGFEGYFFPTAALSPQGRPYSAFPAADHPVLSLIGYRGDLGLDSGAPQSVFVLDKDRLHRILTPGGSPRALLMRPGATLSLGRGVGSITFHGYSQWVKLQISRAPAKVVPLTGVLLAIAGLLGSLFVRPRRTWVRIRESDGRTVVEVAALDRVYGGDPTAHVADVARQLRPAPAPELQEAPS